MSGLRKSSRRAGAKKTNMRMESGDDDDGKDGGGGGGERGGGNTHVDVAVKVEYEAGVYAGTVQQSADGSPVARSNREMVVKLGLV